MLHDLPVGRALRRFRILNGIKQGHVAEHLAVTQASVSRWESGMHEPETAMRERILAMIAASAGNDADAALKRLIETSSAPVHLVCDATHRLLAASPARAMAWADSADIFLNRSLWAFASPEIVAAEEGLAGRGWYDRPFQRLEFHTGHNGSAVIAVLPGTMRWETVPLADGRVGRITTTIACDPA
jgi:transcriptional regulator with XRE-family HTH domain